MAERRPSELTNLIVSGLSRDKAYLKKSPETKPLWLSVPGCSRLYLDKGALAIVLKVQESRFLGEG